MTPEWVEQLKRSADLLGQAQIAVLKQFGEKSDQWRRLYGIRVSLGQEMHRLNLVLEAGQGREK